MNKICKNVVTEIQNWTEEGKFTNQTLNIISV